MKERLFDLSIESQTGDEKWLSLKNYYRKGDKYYEISTYGEESCLPLTTEMWEYSSQEFEHRLWNVLYDLFFSFEINVDYVYPHVIALDYDNEIGRASCRERV